MFLYGGRNQGALVQLALNLRRRFPGLQIVGGYSPPFRDAHRRGGATPSSPRSTTPSADVVWVGIGVPKQEKWMAALRDRLDAPVLVGVGAAFDFHAGPRPAGPGLDAVAPAWSGSSVSSRSRAGCGGATSRYNPRFVYGFARQYLRHRRSRARGDFAA